MNNQVITVTRFGDTTKQAPDCILTSMHDGDNSFLEGRPDLRRAIKIQDRALKQYLDLERDIGANLFASTVAENITRLSQNSTRVDLIQVLHHPRGIIDFNRTLDFPEKAIRNIFDQKAYHVLYQQLLQIHRLGVQEIINYLKQAIAQTIILDCHTMWSHQPRQKIQETPNDLEPYLSAILEAPHTGEQRNVNLLTSRTDTSPISHPQLTTKVINRLTALGIQTCLDWPYNLVDYTTTTQIMETYPHQALSIDWPRSIFTLQDAEGHTNNAHNPQLVEQKIIQLAYIVAASIAECLHTRKTLTPPQQHWQQLDNLP